MVVHNSQVGVGYGSCLVGRRSSPSMLVRPWESILFWALPSEEEVIGEAEHRKTHQKYSENRGCEVKKSCMTKAV